VNEINKNYYKLKINISSYVSLLNILSVVTRVDTNFMCSFFIFWVLTLRNIVYR